jgi:hypothetical protein
MLLGQLLSTICTWFHFFFADTSLRKMFISSAMGGIFSVDDRNPIYIPSQGRRVTRLFFTSVK